MSFSLPTQRQAQSYRSRWSGAAFLVESMLLLVFVMAALAVFTQLFATSAERANQSEALTDAVALATSTAERFCADPQNGAVDFVDGDLRVVCDVASEPREAGTMWKATISVYAANGDAASGGGAATAVAAVVPATDAGAVAGDGNQPIYTINTAKYEGEV